MSDMRLLHIATDNKFLNYALPLFNGIQNTHNSVWIVHALDTLELTKSKVDRVIDPQKLAQSDTSDFDAIILHSLKDDFTEFVLKQPAAMPILWIGWGFDYYDLIAADELQLLLPLTRQLKIDLISKKHWVKRLLHIARRILEPARLVRSKAIERINFFAPVLESEYVALESAQPGLHLPEFLPWNYGSVEDQYALGIDERWVSGKHILIGNSATWTSNHLEAIELVEEAGITNEQTVFIPLSYGEAPSSYADAIAIAATKAFADNQTVIKDFMAIEDYLAILSSCGFVIMNHVRQQALGNIISILYLGSRLFLRRENPTLSELRNYGFILNSTADLKTNNSLIRTPLSLAEQQHNRRLTLEIWGREPALTRTENVVKRLSEKVNSSRISIHKSDLMHDS